MKNLLDVGQRWRCAHCVCLLGFADIWQDPVSGDVFCSECWMSNAVPAPLPVLPPSICEECLIPIRPSRGLQLEGWSGVAEWACICDSCSEPPTPEEESDVISGLLRLLEATDEEG